MDFQITAEQTAILETTRRFAQQRIRPMARMYDREERFRRLGVDIAGGDGHCFDRSLTTGHGGVNGVFSKNDRIVVGKGHR